jgi:RNA polymerase sigma factor (sigma-70 family)
MDEKARDLASDPRHVEYARKKARIRSDRTGADLDAMESAAMYGLCRAAVNFDPSKGFQFLAFADRRIKGEMDEAARAQRFGGRRHAGLSIRSIDDHPDPGQDAVIRDLLASDEDPSEIVDAFDAAEAIIRRLPRRHSRALRLIYLDASVETREAAGQRMGVSANRVTRIQAEAFAMIREAS